MLKRSNILQLWERDALSQQCCLLCRNFGFSKRDSAPWKVRNLEMHTALLQGILSLQNHISWPPKRYTYEEGYVACLFWMLHLLAGMGNVVTMLKTACRPGHFFNTSTRLGHEHIFICRLNFNQWVQFWRNFKDALIASCSLKKHCSSWVMWTFSNTWTFRIPSEQVRIHPYGVDGWRMRIPAIATGEESGQNWEGGAVIIVEILGLSNKLSIDFAAEADCVFFSHVHISVWSQVSLWAQRSLSNYDFSTFEKKTANNKRDTKIGFLGADIF